MMEMNYQKALSNYTHNIESLLYTSPLVDLILQTGKMMSESRFSSLLKTSRTKRTDEEGRENYHIRPDDVSRVQKLFTNKEKVSTSIQIINQSYIVSITSQFDGFISNLLRLIIEERPSVLSTKDKSIKYSDLADFETLDQAKDFFVDKEIETVLRKNHKDQLFWLKSALKLDKLNDEKLFPKIIEVLQRRHMIVHNNSKISKQYIDACSQVGLDTKDLKVGGDLTVDRPYIYEAFESFWLYGVKIGLICWSKSKSLNSDNLFSFVTMSSYELIRKRRYTSAQEIIMFAQQVIYKIHDPSAENKLVNTINLAQAYKWNQQDSEAKTVLNVEDWETRDTRFKLSAYCLKGEFEAVYELMTKVGLDDEYKSYYREWPIFQEICNEEEFTSLFREIFSEEFTRHHTDDDDILQTISTFDKASDLINIQRSFKFGNK